MDRIVQAIVKAVLGYIALWLEAKKAERLEIKVKQMESAAETKEIERALERRAAPDVSSPAAWNKGVKTVVVFLVLILSGSCKYVESRWLIIPAPARPAVPEEPFEWTPRERIISGYAGTLEGLIEDYNKAAAEHNRKNGY